MCFIFIDKYKAHKKYADAYDDVLKKEKAMFEYTSGDNVEQSQIDKKSKEVSESYKKNPIPIVYRVILKFQNITHPFNLSCLLVVFHLSLFSLCLNIF